MFNVIKGNLINKNVKAVVIPNEIYENLPNDLDKITHFSSFHNKQGIQGKFTLDFLLKNVTLRAGFSHNNQTWQGNDLNFKQSQFNILIGATYNIIRLGGKKAEK